MALYTALMLCHASLASNDRRRRVVSTTSGSIRVDRKAHKQKEPSHQDWSTVQVCVAPCTLLAGHPTIAIHQYHIVCSHRTTCLAAKNTRTSRSSEAKITLDPSHNSPPSTTIHITSCLGWLWWCGFYSVTSPFGAKLLPDFDPVHLRSLSGRRRFQELTRDPRPKTARSLPCPYK